MTCVRLSMFNPSLRSSLIHQTSILIQDRFPKSFHIPQGIRGIKHDLLANQGRDTKEIKHKEMAVCLCASFT